jgi:hypothetical protein
MSAELNATDAIVGKLKAVQKTVQKSTMEIVLAMVLIGELLVQLRRKANGSWTHHLDDLGYNERVARRYMALGRSWWARNGLKDSGLAADLPSDLLKLEWLCRLSKDQLQEGIRNWRCCEWARSVVIDAVKRVLNIAEPAKPAAHITLDRLSDECDRFIDRVLDAMECSSTLLEDETARQRLHDQLEEKFGKFLDVILESRDSSVAEEASEPTAEEPPGAGPNGTGQQQ